MGDTDEGCNWHVGGSSGIHLPESEFEFVDGGAELQVADIDALLCLDKGAKNGAVLFAKEAETPSAAVYDWAHNNSNINKCGKQRWKEFQPSISSGWRRKYMHHVFVMIYLILILSVSDRNHQCIYNI